MVESISSRFRQSRGTVNIGMIAMVTAVDNSTTFSHPLRVGEIANFLETTVIIQHFTIIMTSSVQHERKPEA